jgi:hypothetical protein
VALSQSRRDAFGSNAFDRLPSLVAGRRYALVTYPDAAFAEVAERLRDRAGTTVLAVDRSSPLRVRWGETSIAAVT